MSDWFSKWDRAHPQNTLHNRRIRRGHAFHPNAILAQLRGHAEESRVKPLSALKQEKLSTIIQRLVKANLQTAQEENRYRRALEALHLVRNEKISLSEATRRSRINLESVIQQMGPAFRKTPGGKWEAKPFDRLARRLKFYDDRGLTGVTTRSSKTASLIAEYMNAVNKLSHGDSSGLERFKGKSFKDISGKTWFFITDLALLKRFLDRGEARFEDLYQ